MQAQELSYYDLRVRWGYDPVAESQTLGVLLRRLREQGGYSAVEQRCRFGLARPDFRCLQRMPILRSEHFSNAVRQMAFACNVAYLRDFATAMEQAQAWLELA